MTDETMPAGRQECPGCGEPLDKETSEANDRPTYVCRSYYDPDEPPEFCASWACLGRQLVQRDSKIGLLVEAHAQAIIESDRLQAIVDKVPAKKILAACALIDDADRRALAADGVVTRTAEELTANQLQTCLSALWATREAADAAKEQKEGTEAEDGAQA